MLRGSLFQLYCCSLFARVRVTLVQCLLDKRNAASGSETGVAVLVIVFLVSKVESIFRFSSRKLSFTPRPV